MFGRKVHWSLICILLQVCLFSKSISLGMAENIEATFNIRYELTSENYNFKVIIYTNKYKLFEDYFFNKKITSITLTYSFYGSDIYIINITDSSERIYNGIFYSCQNVPSLSLIQCNKIHGDDSGKCLNGTGLQWFYKDEYLISSHFKNITLQQENNYKVVCYILLNSVTSTTIKALTTGSSTAPVTITTDDSSASLSGVIAGVSIAIFIVTIVIVIIVVILKKRKHNKASAGRNISHRHSSNRTNAYNEQVSNTREEGSNTNTQFPGSTMEASKDDYTCIDDDDTSANGPAVDDGYSTLDQTLADFDESVEQPQGTIRAGVPNYNNVDVENANRNKETGRKKDVYSKLGEQVRNFQNTYGELDRESPNEEEDSAELEVNNVYFILENENTNTDTIGRE